MKEWPKRERERGSERVGGMNREGESGIERKGEREMERLKE